jgi:hypothetical protein
MPHSETKSKRSRRGGEKPGKSHLSRVASRYTVGLAPGLANEVQRYAETADTSVVHQADAILFKAALPRLTFSRISEALAVQIKGFGR